MSTARLTLVHARYELLETVRIPIAVIGALVFPVLSLLFFVVPQRVVADDPLLATQAVISLCVFGVLANGLFGFGLGIAEKREKPWDPYLRTLPAPAISRVVGLILATGALSLAAVVPVVVVGALLTEAEAPPLRILAGFVALAAVSVPFMLLGMAVGYSLPSKGAVAVVQVLMFGLAFAGGLFLPPQMFPGWLDALSQGLPSRAARDLVVWAVQGGPLNASAVIAWAAWTAGALVLVLVLHRRDEGARYR
ncbi:ABC transporter permease [Clavibacter californiensis]|uniref:ABC transporter permease n=1 Tax=Clavibacter californiensis TaxID=1401995 RepID=A0ABX9N430_9MICO|nr:ABC transporter permease [Clavibacter californiensis]RII89915.1 ABC transporter permease [Clavibacter californiensis]UKF80435.1 ABC transporter permease [Clavibacter californiensis]